MTKVNGIWKSGKGRGRRQPKGRQVDESALTALRDLLKSDRIVSDRLIEHLHRIQDHYGHINTNHIAALAYMHKRSQSEVYEVASFYAHFDVVGEDEETPPPITIRVCDSLSCKMQGAQSLMQALSNLYGEDIRIVRAPCMGRCANAPTVEIGHKHIDHANLENIAATLKNGDFQPDIPNYQDLSAYRDAGGYHKLEAWDNGTYNFNALSAEIEQSGLRGLGGAGFPTFKKWAFVRKENGPRYLAVNADEGEPGTFKDRYYLETEPHRILEGMLLAARAVNTQKIYFYLRDEYPAARHILATELEALYQTGLIAEGFVELRRGAGAYICGEESAMIESIEGKRGLPRHRPPYVAQKGLFGRPTLVHNVETLYWVSRIANEGPEILNGVRKNGRTGLRSYSVSGRVKKPGVKLLPAGSTIMDVIDASGGMQDGHKFTAYQPGGPSSGLLPASLNNIALDFDTLQKVDSFIGSAAIVVLSNQDDLKHAILNMMRFFEDESCGQCTPCRLGCEKAVKLLDQGCSSAQVLHDLCDVMEDASICGLGQAAPNPVRSWLRYFSQGLGQ